MVSLVVLSALAMPRASLYTLLPITFDAKFSAADTTPIVNSIRHSLKANIFALHNGTNIQVEELDLAQIKPLMIKAGLKGSTLPLLYGELSALQGAHAKGRLVQCRVTDFTLKMEKGVSKPTFTASATAKFWLAPIAAGVKQPAEGTSVSVSVPAKSILMDKATMHKLCGTLSKKIVGEMKAPLGFK